MSHKELNPNLSDDEITKFVKECEVGFAYGDLTPEQERYLEDGSHNISSLTREGYMIVYDVIVDPEIIIDEDTVDTFHLVDREGKEMFTYRE